MVTESPSTTITTATTVTQTLTINQLSTTTPATSTITAVTTSFTGRAACAYNRVVRPVSLSTFFFFVDNFHETACTLDGNAQNEADRSL